MRLRGHSDSEYGLQLFQAKMMLPEILFNIFKSIDRSSEIPSLVCQVRAMRVAKSECQPAVKYSGIVRLQHSISIAWLDVMCVGIFWLTDLLHPGMNSTFYLHGMTVNAFPLTRLATILCLLLLVLLGIVFALLTSSSLARFKLSFLASVFLAFPRTGNFGG